METNNNTNNTNNTNPTNEPKATVDPRTILDPKMAAPKGDEDTVLNSNATEKTVLEQDPKTVLDQNKATAAPQQPAAGAKPFQQAPIPNVHGIRPMEAPKDNNKVLKAVAIGAGIVAGAGVAAAATYAAVNHNNVVEPEDADDEKETSKGENNEGENKYDPFAQPGQGGEEPGNEDPAGTRGGNDEVPVTHVVHHHVVHTVDYNNPIEPGFHVTQAATVEMEDGELVNMVSFDNGTNIGAFLDIDRDGNADMVWVDMNGDGLVTEDEVMSLEDRVVSMDYLAYNIGSNVGIEEAGIVTHDELLDMQEEIVMKEVMDEIEYVDQYETGHGEYYNETMDYTDESGSDYTDDYTNDAVVDHDVDHDMGDFDSHMDLMDSDFGGDLV